MRRGRAAREWQVGELQVEGVCMREGHRQGRGLVINPWEDRRSKSLGRQEVQVLETLSWITFTSYTEAAGTDTNIHRYKHIGTDTQAQAHAHKHGAWSQEDEVP